MKRILHCTLIFMVLVMSGCDFFTSPDTSSSPNTNSLSDQPEKHTIQFKEAAQDVNEALTKLTSPGRAGQVPKVRPVKDEIDDAIKKLGPEATLRERCTDCTDETKGKAISVLASLKRTSEKLETVLTKNIADLDDDLKNEFRQNLTDGGETLNELSRAEPKTIEAPSPSPSLTQPNSGNTEASIFSWETLILVLKVGAGMVALVLLALVLNVLWKRAWKTVEFNVGQVVAGHIAASREVQPDYAPKLSSLSSAQAEMSNRLSELDTEVRSLARFVRESLATRRSDRGDGFNYQSYAQEPAPKDEPEFPVSAVDYLGKMDRFANVVRPDFQNGILVNDPDGNGELVLIRDSRDERQPLFVVPRATQFHTKQDFYTYYQKYYDCARPSAGDVWIIGPAVVEKVSGGWQLREKGMLEVR
jgi:hypothetical protein